MILIYMHPDADFVATRLQLQNEGLVLNEDFKVHNWLCFRMVESPETITRVYTNIPNIKDSYEHHSIEVIDISKGLV